MTLEFATRAALLFAGAVLITEVIGLALLAPTSAADCGRCSFGQELLQFLVFAILPGLLVGLLAAALANRLRDRHPGSDVPESPR